jgi:hypothetical protein
MAARMAPANNNDPRGLLASDVPILRRDLSRAKGTERIVLL